MQTDHDEIGDDAMREVFAAVDDGTIAYVGDDPTEPGASTADWRRHPRPVEIVGGSQRRTTTCSTSTS